MPEIKTRRFGEIGSIKSPGLPQRPVTLKQLQDFSASALSRDPILHYVFAHMRLAEERGLGLKSLKARAEELGLTRPAYTWDAPYLVLTLYRSPESASSSLDAKVRDALSADELSGWEQLTRLEVVAAPKYADAIGVDIRTAQRHLRHFTELGLLRRVGKGRAPVRSAQVPRGCARGAAVGLPARLMVAVAWATVANLQVHRPTMLLVQCWEAPRELPAPGSSSATRLTPWRSSTRPSN
jgi:hypothetical protein